MKGKNNNAYVKQVSTYLQRASLLQERTWDKMFDVAMLIDGGSTTQKQADAVRDFVSDAIMKSACSSKRVDFNKLAQQLLRKFDTRRVAA